MDIHLCRHLFSFSFFFKNVCPPVILKTLITNFDQDFFHQLLFSQKVLGQASVKCKRKSQNNLQFGMLMPAGMPLPPKVRTSREVKSGLRNTSFS